MDDKMKSKKKYRYPNKKKYSVKFLTRKYKTHPGNFETDNDGQLIDFSDNGDIYYSGIYKWNDGSFRNHLKGYNTAGVKIKKKAKHRSTR
jgi:hypothetical protein